MWLFSNGCASLALWLTHTHRFHLSPLPHWLHVQSAIGGDSCAGMTHLFLPFSHSMVIITSGGAGLPLLVGLTCASFEWRFFSLVICRLVQFFPNRLLQLFLLTISACFIWPTSSEARLLNWTVANVSGRWITHARTTFFCSILSTSKRLPLNIS